MKYLSLFSGIGAFEKALDMLEIPYELVGYCEIEKYASKSYSVIHDVPETMNLGDITKIDEKALPKDIDLITYGFPCQDISLAGKQKGLFNEDGSQTRSGLFFEALRIIEETQPKVAIAENVKNLVGKKFNAQFQVVLASLETAGYNNYWQVLNAKDYGIPQNRERVFIVSIRKDIDTGSFKFPEPFPLELRLKDMLEDEVDEKFYLDGKFESITKVNDNYSTLNGGTIGKMHDISRRVYNENATAPSIHTCAGGNLQPKVAVAMRGRYNAEGKIEQNIEVSDREVANAITTVQKDSMVAEPTIQRIDIPQTVTSSSAGNEKILVREATKKGYAEATEGDSINLEQPNSKTRRGRVGHGVAQTLTTAPQQGVVITPATSFVNGDVCKTVRASGHGSIDRHSWDMVHHNLRIRKLTPKECFRLMGFSDEDFAKAEAVNSNTQLYKQAGNSIVVDVIAHIFTQLKELHNETV
jgi:DNA (cytosine-5)-methyltransferase 1